MHLFHFNIAWRVWEKVFLFGEMYFSKLADWTRV